MALPLACALPCTSAAAGAAAVRQARTGSRGLRTTARESLVAPGVLTAALSADATLALQCQEHRHSESKCSEKPIHHDAVPTNASKLLDSYRKKIVRTRPEEYLANIHSPVILFEPQYSSDLARFEKL